MSSRVLIGSDTGGTFTDLVRIDADGVRSWKLPSTPDDFAHAVLEGVERLLEDRPLGPARVELVHSTTVATNALLERNGARVALLSTRGFRDVLAIGRQARPELYDLAVEKPAPLVPDELRLEVDERVTAEGKVLRAMDPGEVERVLDRAVEAGAEAVAVSLLFSFLYPDHERAIGEIARGRGLPVSLSSEVSAEFREYERTSTTVINAYVGPVLERYLERLADGLRERGVSGLRVVHSNGGSVRAAGGRAVQTVLSGPAAGVLGALSAASEALGESPAIVTFDMGGTSTDVSFVSGSPRRLGASLVGGHPIQIPMIDVHTVGAGGGSIAWIDAGGALRVGPGSAGADPGPACYGSSDLPTVTDAHVVLGRIVPSRFLGGRMQLRPERAAAALETLGKRMGTDAETAARAVIAVVEAEMERALRVVSVRRGHDPRATTLVSFGGAGGLHACALAEALGMRDVLVPRDPGVLSALGAARSDVVREYGRTVLRRLEDGIADLEAVLEEMRARAESEMDEEGLAAADLVVSRSADLRYRGQSYELEVEYDPDPDRLASRFHAAHRERYGHAADDEPVEVVTVRLRVFARVALPGRPRPPGAGRRSPAPAAEPAEGLPALDRDALVAGQGSDGPALIVEPYATTLVPEGWRARVEGHGHLLIERVEG